MILVEILLVHDRSRKGAKARFFRPRGVTRKAPCSSNDFSTDGKPHSDRDVDLPFSLPCADTRMLVVC